MKQIEVESLPITLNYFMLLIKEIQTKFLTNHQLKELPKALQLYGYDNYDETKPSLKTDLEAIGTEFINGKYFPSPCRDPCSRFNTNI